MPTSLPRRFRLVVSCGLVLLCMGVAVGCATSRAPAGGSAAEAGSEGVSGALQWGEGDPIRQLYHVQVGTAERKAAASRTLSTVQMWWADLAPSERPRPLAQRSELPVAIAWHTPYYRVRIGPFVRREHARAMLQVAASAFPDAIIALEPAPAPSPND